MKCFALFLVLFLLNSGQSISQANSYFNHNETWGGQFWITNTYNSFYFIQVGDTVLYSDTLKKLEKVTNMSPYDTSFFLAKNELEIMTLYPTDNNYFSYSDSIIYDFSRLDSVTVKFSNFFGSPNHFAEKIVSIDTVQIGTNSRKLFHIYDGCGQSDNDYVYEGVVGIDNLPFFTGCFEGAHLLNCFSYNDTIYLVTDSIFTQYPSSINYTSCIIPHIGITELKNSQKTLIKIVDLTGRETQDRPNTVLIYIYSDGTTEKVFRIE